MANKISTVRTYTLNGAVDFTITFEYLARKFVQVTLIGKDRKELVLNQDYRFTTKTQITTSRAWTAADGYQLIEIRRFTSATDRLVDFADGSILRAYDLNISQIQTLHVSEEARDLTADTIGVNNDGHLDARGRRIVNLANAVDDRDAVPFGQLKTMDKNSWQARNEALQFRNEAETFRNKAEGFKNESSTHATNAKQWRDEANEFRNEAEQFKNTSGQYAASAGNSAGNAKDSEDEARRIAESIRAAGLFGYITRQSFEKGFNLTVWNEVLLWEEEGEYYRWDGTLPKNVPAGSTPEESGWVSVGDASLRSDLAKDDGYRLIPSVKIPQWKDVGDIRGWGALCDGVTDDINAITQAIADTGGRIVIPKDTFVSTHILFNGLTDVCVSMLNGAKVKIDTSFVFNPSYRGIFEFVACHNVITRDLNILGAKLDKLNAPEPWQDGDAGIEYSNCSGILHAINPVVTDVKTWGIIHVACTKADSIIDNPVMTNCQVQSGIGGTGYRSLTINGGEYTDIGLYGVELETRARNVRTTINGGTALLCNKGFATVNNSDNVLIFGAKAINCKTGFSLYSDDSVDESFRGENQWIKSCVATSCKNSFELVYPRNSGVTGCTEDRDSIDYFTRTRALDRIVKIINGKAYVALDSPSENHGLTVGAVIQMDDEVQFTLATVDPTPTVDAVFGHVIGFTVSTSMDSGYVRSSFRRYVQISTGKTSLVLYGGNNVFIHGNDFSRSESVLASYGNHVNLQWYDNNTYSCQHYFAQGSTGTVSGSVRSETGQNLNLGDWGSTGKFSSAIKSGISLRFDNEANHDSTVKPRYITVEDATLLARVRVVVDPGSTTTGTVVLKLNGTDAVTLGGSPLVGESVLSPLITTAGNISIRLVDSVGDIVATGYSVKLYHLAK